jgi:hypothetical protein
MYYALSHNSLIQDGRFLFTNYQIDIPMKKTNITMFLMLVVILFLSVNSFVQGQPPGPPGEHGLNGNHGPGGAAPLDGGSLFLLLGGTVYGAFKLIRANYRKKER